MKVVQLSALRRSRFHPPGDIPDTQVCGNMSHAGKEEGLSLILWIQTAYFTCSFTNEHKCPREIRPLPSLGNGNQQQSSKCRVTLIVLLLNSIDILLSSKKKKKKNRNEWVPVTTVWRTSGCGRRSGFHYGGQLRMYWISSRGQQTRGGPPAVGWVSCSP
jgi:hypothetical protein